MQDGFNDPLWRQVVSGAQMLFVAFGALVLMPLITGLDPNVALFTAGIVAMQTSGGGRLADIACVVFVLARIGHGLCYAMDLATLRSSLFVVSFLAVLSLFMTALL